MLFIANNLEKNGGSTFLIRYLRATPNNSVLVLNKSILLEIEEQISNYSSVFYLEDFLYKCVPKQICKFYVISFWFVNFKKFFRVIKETHFHSLGIFGLIFAIFAIRFMPLKISFGIYHLNEVVFNTRNKFLSNAINSIFFSNPKIGLIFFNDFCKRYYEKHFGREFHYSVTLPIGISYNDNLEIVKFRRKEIVSVGNLVKFKTYNEHVIKSLPKLLEKFQLRYLIYGSGENELHLKKIASNLGLDAYVEFRGDLPYGEFIETISESTLFIGSGTAVLEAASSGVISMMGIDSCPLPLTYGFVSDIVGYDYNEYDSSKKTYSFYETIEKVFLLDEADYESLAFNCKQKAKEFDICNTVYGFENFENSLKYSSIKEYSFYFISKLSLIFLFVGLSDILGVTRTFRFRRNQGNEN